MCLSLVIQWSLASKACEHLVHRPAAAGFSREPKPDPLGSPDRTTRSQRVPIWWPMRSYASHTPETAFQPRHAPLSLHKREGGASPKEAPCDLQSTGQQAIPHKSGRIQQQQCTLCTVLAELRWERIALAVRCSEQQQPCAHRAQDKTEPAQCGTHTGTKYSHQGSQYSPPLLLPRTLQP